MGSMPRRLSVAFTAGVIGAIANSLALQLIGLAKPGAAPPPSPPWIYQRLVWGGLFGLLLLLPILKGRPVARGLVVSVAPSVARLTIFSPPGAALSALIVIMTFLFNAIWGAVAGLWQGRAGEG